MWPFEQSEHSAVDAPALAHPREGEPERPHQAGLADRATYVRLFESWSQSDHREMVSAYQLGCLRARKNRHVGRRRRLPPLPMLQFLVEPGESIEFADRLSGFPGLARRPPPERVLRLWADDLLSISHGDDWIYVVDATEPFPSEWLGLLTPPRGAPFKSWYAAVFASYAGPTPAGEFHVTDVDATTYTTLVHVEDHRECVRRPPRLLRGKGFAR